MGSFSIGHWLIVLVVVLLVFGPARVARAGKSLGEGMRNLRKGLEGDTEKSPAPKRRG